MPVYEAVCRDCEWHQAAPGREQAQHAKRVHQRERDHRVTLEVELES